MARSQIPEGKQMLYRDPATNENRQGKASLKDRESLTYRFSALTEGQASPWAKEHSHTSSSCLRCGGCKVQQRGWLGISTARKSCTGIAEQWLSQSSTLCTEPSSTEGSACSLQS